MLDEVGANRVGLNIADGGGLQLRGGSVEEAEGSYAPAQKRGGVSRMARTVHNPALIRGR